MNSGTNWAAIDRRRRDFFARFQGARDIDNALHSSENPTPLFFLDLIKTHPDLKDAGLALGRLGPNVERRFNINGEVAFFFVKWRDFQRRSFNAIGNNVIEIAKEAQVSQGLTERFTPTQKISFVICPDQRLPDKVEEWQHDSTSPTLIIPISIADGSPEITRDLVLSALRDKLGDRDLYRNQNPVTGDDFFGRSDLLKRATAAITADENVGFFGLRRSGKSSVLHELKRRLLPRGTIMTLGDLQGLDSDSTESIANSILALLIDDLRSARSIHPSIRIGNESEQHVGDVSLPQLSDRIKRIANRNSTFRFVIAIDEVENALRIAQNNPNQVRVLFAALRQAAQACPNVSLAFSGVASRLFEKTILGAGETAVDNPMYGQVSPYYLSSFSIGETGDLLNDLGRPMFLSWTPDAIGLVHRNTGGMPYLVRKLASIIRGTTKTSQDDTDFEMREITEQDVAAALPGWSAEAGIAWGQLVSALRLHYPDAADLLDPGLTPGELSQWISATPEAADAAQILQKLGLLTTDLSGNWRISGALEAMHSLQDGRAMGTSSDMYSGSPADEALSLIRTGENHWIEFKQTCRVDIRTMQKAEHIEHSAIKTICAFANTDGGTLLIGVTDDGEVVGIDRDVKLHRNSVDKFELWLRGDFIARRTSQPFASTHLAVHFLEVRGSLICRVDVTKSPSPVWLDDRSLYIRTGNQTRELNGRELQEFLLKRASE